MDRLEVSFEGRPCYDIVFSDSFGGLLDSIDSLGFSGRRIAVITDDIVSKYWLDDLLKELEGHDGELLVHTFPAGEDNKHLDTVGDIYEFLIKNRFDRHDLLIALGGGVCGDMTGFAAATYLRGVSFIQIPTTLLAQCDSSIGGKTGVDFKGYKNMVGAFYMPRLVFMNMSTLKTLDDRQFSAGFTEVIKHGMIADSDYFDFLIKNRDAILRRDPETLTPMIKRSCEIKRQVVEEDPKEQGVRATLNFGHTIGHAIEKYRDFKLLHGESVSLGICAAAAIALERGYITSDERERIVSGLESFSLPIRETGLDAEKIISLVKSDKKMDGGRVKFILLKPLGRAVIVNDVSDAELRGAIEAIS